MKIRMACGGLTPESGTSWLTNYQNASRQNGTTGKATGHTTDRKESFPRQTKKTARPSMESGFTQEESQNWSNTNTVEATSDIKTNRQQRNPRNEISPQMLWKMVVMQAAYQADG
ncbi:hypothetical protein ECED1_0920 [Escherichia coli ED1a]|uniref:Uncharacterized protein n=1 Tax=Escherichia coli O81 (strain ED1a) TaxID=585397 RepID=B7MS08_ECO81|nr:hypothetical protein ECED1_0920 [Escherichia coli ED1a]